MNRRERRHMQKELGLNKFYKKQNNVQWAERIRENIENGRRMHEENTEKVRVMQNMTKEEKESAEIAVLAQQIAMKKGTSLLDAMDEAQTQYKKSKK